MSSQPDSENCREPAPNYNLHCQDVILKNKESARIRIVFFSHHREKEVGRRRGNKS